jgi:peptide/nickel transport system permease protein
VRDTLRLGAAPGARARGLPEWRVLLKYAFVPGAGSLAAYLGTQLGGLFVGGILVEVIFDWKGLGTLLVESVLKRDYPVIEAATFVAASATLIGTFIGDSAQRRIDPRIAERSPW